MMIEKLRSALEHSPPAKIAVKFFDGDSWDQLSYNELRNNVELMISSIETLTNSSRTCLGLHIAPFLGLPVLIMSSVLSFCPFLILDDLDSGKDEVKARLDKLQIRFLISDRSLSVGYLKFESEFELVGRNLAFFSYAGSNSGTVYDQTADCSYVYAITTSGSTGVPKTVCVPAESIYPNIVDFSRELKISSEDVIILSSPLTFDPSMVELFLALTNAAQLIIVSESVRSCAALLANAVLDGGVTFYQTTPSLFRLWPDDLKRNLLGKATKLKSLVLGGEKFPLVAEIEAWAPEKNVSIYNTYGITEVSCWASLKMAWPYEKMASHWKHGVDIGAPLSETLFKTEDEDGLHHLLIGSSSRVCPIDDDSFEKIHTREPIFRPTGDLFEIIDGKYYFACRVDSVVKRFGKKVVLSQIEHAAAQVGIECAVARIPVNEKPDVGSRLVMFVDRALNENMKNSMVTLKNALPSHYWPDDVHCIDSFPLSPHGKVDRKQLVRIYSQARAHKPADTDFAKLWNYFTCGSYIRPTDISAGFISSGGDSFSAVLFISRLEEHGVTCRSTDLLLKLLKDAPYRECIRSAFPGDEPKQMKSLSPGTQVTESETSSSGSSQMPNIFAYMGLKGRTWPSASPFGEKFHVDQPLVIEFGWCFDLKKCVDASPLAVTMVTNDGDGLNSFIIIGSHSGLVVVLDATTGVLRSQLQLPNRVEASACMSMDLKSYYIGCYDGKVYNVKLSDGSILWTFSTEDMIKATCVTHNGKIFFGSYDKKVYAITDAGNLSWSATVGPVTVPVVPHQDNILVATLACTVLCLQIDRGAILWSCSVGAPVFSNLALVENYRTHFIVSPVDGRLQLRDILDSSETGSLKLAGAVFSSPVELHNSGKILIADGNNLNFIQLFPKAAILWTKSFTNRIVSTPITFDKYIASVTIDGLVTVMKLIDGETVCTYELPGEVFSSPVVIGSSLYVGCRDNNFYCLKIIHDNVQ